MKIRQIRFRNINAFYGEHAPIEFQKDPLGSTGLFVISGPTGAGKSTLLDVMTLALFNRIPRISGPISLANIEQEGLLVNRQAAQEPKATAYAEVEYEVGGQAYRAKWSIAKNRNGNWNNYEMEIARLAEGNAGGELLPIKNLREFPAKNEELIGLTYEQFVRSIVLAQGAFDQFLKAKAGDRSKMLEKITGTEIYRQLSQKAYEINKEYEGRLADQRRGIGSITLLPDEEIDRLKAEQKELNALLKDIKKQLDYFTEEEKQLTRIQEAETALKRLGDRAMLLQTNKAAFAESADRLEKHEKVADLAGTLTDIANAESARQTADRDRQLAELAITDLTTNIEAVVASARHLTQQPLLDESSIETAVANFRDTVLQAAAAVEAEREKAKLPFKSVQQTLENTTDEWCKTLDLKDLDNTSQQVGQRLKQVNVALVRREENYPAYTPDKVSARLNQLYEHETVLGSLIRSLEMYQTHVHKGTELKVKIDLQAGQLLEKEKKHEQLSKRLAGLRERKNKLDAERKKFMESADIQQLRAALQPGEPCPLCGALEHPFVQHIYEIGQREVEFQLIEKELNELEDNLEESKTILMQARANHDVLTHNIEELRKECRLQKNEISAQLVQVGFEPNAMPERLKDEQKLIQVERADLTALQSLWQQEATLRRLLYDLEEVQRVKLRTEELRLLKERLYTGPDVKSDCDRLLKTFADLNGKRTSQQGLKAKAIQSLGEAQEKYQSFLVSLLPLLTERGFTSPAEARAALLDATTVQRLRKQKSDLENEAHDIASKRRDEEQKRTDALTARKTDFVPEEIAEKLKTLKKDEAKGQQNIGYTKRMLDEDGEKRKRLKNLSDNLQILEGAARPWQELNRLIGSAKGDEYGKFAQSLTLSQLIGLANQRLKDLTDRYVLLKPHDGQEELYVLDLYQGGSERSVSSLSGGETFTLSLALALALSDLASQNVQIDSLFIDEGFGTLDPETLDTAIVMLEKLQQDSKKTIGIISHRHEIKERISVQIQLEKGSDGNSRISITN